MGLGAAGGGSCLLDHLRGWLGRAAQVGQADARNFGGVPRATEVPRSRSGGKARPVGRIGTYFTAPLVMPEMIFRWATAKTAINGRLMTIT